MRLRSALKEGYKACRIIALLLAVSPAECRQSPETVMMP